ncbi:MAG: hypothetical protein U9R50_10215 [Campylobacterota bacterium]|nr:hypothetical protein [Campylobacterota bacterium]
MTYIIVALLIEAKPLIKHYSLKRIDEPDILLFANEEILLCVTQVGYDNAFLTTQRLFQYRKAKECDIMINLGLCGAPKEYKLGSLLLIDKIVYQKQISILDITIEHSCIESTLLSVTQAQSSTAKTPVDMEADAIYRAVSDFMNPHQLLFVKIVSDHFKPESLTKNLAYGLINKQIKVISSLIYALQRNI